MEKEKRAFGRSLLLMLLLPLPFLLAFYLEIHFIDILLCVLVITGLLAFLIPLKTPSEITDAEPIIQHDERDTMFSRNELVPGSERYNNYYKKNPEKESLDMNFRKKPGLLSANSLYYNKKAFEAADASFAAVNLLHSRVDGPPAMEKQACNPKDATKNLLKKTKQLGALDVGFVSIKPYHFYNTKGRGEDYGKEIKSNHKFAIAFTVEMDREMVKPAPQASIVMESAKQYLNSGTIAVALAEHIRSMGYEARAHIDGNYQLICPLVARDAGLGEIGRMGLLMTPKQGPRVRIAVVSTNLELITHTYNPDNSVLDFCMQCKKCANTCPSASIEFNEPQLREGIKRWKIISEKCYTFWCISGTDCGRCMAVCPYSHPEGGIHLFIRWGIKKSHLFRLFAAKMDDFFYGKHPKPFPLPKWLSE
ncbi:MAG: 4Fe-4S dicluster domain-containing protein [Lentimicrobium sp.]|nr:4Fe-4S dicluster domain-containing protein [Lentimicrobium sp.]